MMLGTIALFAALVLPAAVAQDFPAEWQAVCMNGPSSMDPCVSVDDDWDTLVDTMENAPDGVMMVLCPFTVQKPSMAAKGVRPRSNTLFACVTAGDCVFEGPGQHINLNNDAANVMLYGFRFTGATESAVHVRDLAVMKQSICQCFFEDNVIDNRGAGLRTELGTTVDVWYSEFTGNMAGRGGGIYSRGNLNVVDSIFTSNTANQGAGIAIAGYSSLMVQGSSFRSNVATLGPAIFGDEPEILVSEMYVDGGGNSAINESCQGILVFRLNRSSNGCVVFSGPAPSSSMVPSDMPSLMPSGMPAAATSHVPSDMPSLHPSQLV